MSLQNSIGSTELNVSRAVAGTPAPPPARSSHLTCWQPFLRGRALPLLLVGTHEALHPDGHRVPVRCHVSILLRNFMCLEGRPPISQYHTAPRSLHAPQPHGPHMQQGGRHQSDKQFKVSKASSPFLLNVLCPRYVLELNLRERGASRKSGGAAPAHSHPLEKAQDQEVCLLSSLITLHTSTSAQGEKQNCWLFPSPARSHFRGGQEQSIPGDKTLCLFSVNKCRLNKYPRSL